MAVFQNARIYHGEKRLDTDLTAVSFSYEAEAVDDTVFNDDTRSREGGLKLHSVGYEGLYTTSTGSTSSEEILFSDVGESDIPIALSASTGATGDVVHFSRYLYSSFEHGGTIGDQHSFSGAAVSKNDPPVRGFVMTEETVTANGNSTGVDIGTLSSSETLYGTLHVTASSGTGNQTLDVTIQSDAASGFASPSTHLTFTQITTSASFDFQLSAGAISDNLFRADWTIGGSSNPAFDIFVAVGKF